MSASPRFLADAMLGRLARWLRLLGVDTADVLTRHDPDLFALDLLSTILGRS